MVFAHVVAQLALTIRWPPSRPFESDGLIVFAVLQPVGGLQTDPMSLASEPAPALSVATSPEVSPLL